MSRAAEAAAARPYDLAKMAEHRAVLDGLGDWLERSEALLAEHDAGRAWALGPLPPKAEEFWAGCGVKV